MNNAVIRVLTEGKGAFYQRGILLVVKDMMSIMDMLELIRTRRSIRRYKKEAVLRTWWRRYWKQGDGLLRLATPSPGSSSS